MVVYNLNDLEWYALLSRQHSLCPSKCSKTSEKVNVFYSSFHLFVVCVCACLCIWALRRNENNVWISYEFIFHCTLFVWFEICRLLSCWWRVVGACVNAIINKNCVNWKRSKYFFDSERLFSILFFYKMQWHNNDGHFFLVCNLIFTLSIWHESFMYIERSMAHVKSNGLETNQTTKSLCGFLYV